MDKLSSAQGPMECFGQLRHQLKIEERHVDDLLDTFSAGLYVAPCGT